MGDYLPFVHIGTTRSVLSGCGGESHTCAILDDYSLKCWGLNTNGELGYGDVAQRGDGVGEMGDYLSTVNVGTGLVTESVHCGQYHTCAVLSNGISLKCWGLNTNGQLGQGSTTTLGDGTGEMGDYLAVVSLGTGLQVETCFDLTPTFDPSFSLDPTFDPTFFPTMDPTFDPTVYTYPSYSCKSDFAGFTHNCILFTDYTFKCWGYNAMGQLGYEDSTNRGDSVSQMGDSLPFVDISGSAVSISSGSNYGCAVLDNMSAKCWGENIYGQLGYGTTSNKGDQPNEMGSNLPTINVGSNILVSFIVTGNYHTCIVTGEGAIKCWGYNFYGQLGYGDEIDRGSSASEMGDYLSLVDLGTGCTVAEDLVAGNHHNCVICSNGLVKCWGMNSEGQLGLGDVVNRGNAPFQMGDYLPTVDIEGTSGLSVSSLIPGHSHTCVCLQMVL